MKRTAARAFVTTALLQLHDGPVPSVKDNPKAWNDAFDALHDDTGVIPDDVLALLRNIDPERTGPVTWADAYADARVFALLFNVLGRRVDVEHGN